MTEPLGAEPPAGGPAPAVLAPSAAVLRATGAPHDEAVRRLTHLVLTAPGRVPLRAVAAAVEQAGASLLADAVVVVEAVRGPLELGLMAGAALPDATRRAAYPAAVVPSGPLLGTAAVHHRRFRATDELAPGSLLRAFGLIRGAAAPAMWHGEPLGAVSAYWPADAAGEPTSAEAVLTELAASWAAALGVARVGRAAVLQSRRWRQDLAAAVHDDALQALIGVDLRLQRLAGRLQDPVQADLLVEVRQSNTDAVDEVRRLLRRLRGADTAAARSAGEIVRRIAAAVLDGGVGPSGAPVRWTLLADDDLPLGPLAGELLAELSGDALDAVRLARPSAIDIGIRADAGCVLVELEVAGSHRDGVRRALDEVAHQLAPVLAVTGGEINVVDAEPDGDPAEHGDGTDDAGTPTLLVLSVPMVG